MLTLLVACKLPPADPATSPETAEDPTAPEAPADTATDTGGDSTSYWDKSPGGIWLITGPQALAG